MNSSDIATSDQNLVGHTQVGWGSLAESVLALEYNGKVLAFITPHVADLDEYAAEQA